MRDIIHTAAALAAKLDKSDPFAYARYVANIRQGCENAQELLAWACEKHGIKNNARDIRMALERP